ncbi:MAG: Nif3-like dinuclear metal center hexameric protein [Paramuribaculum sp.]|nr:Nif3-like dinuclear metal center hexameric protein [Paramuribaculum sp.]
MTVRISDIITALEKFAPSHLQESYDNSGIQIGDNLDADCTGVLLAVDPTPGVVREAIQTRCNLIITHHPLLFRGLKTITGANPVDRTAIEAIRNGITLYSCHTSLDRCAGGVSHVMAQMLALKNIRSLEQSDTEGIGLGAIGELDNRLSPVELIELIKHIFDSPIVRHTTFNPDTRIKTVALCGGSGSSLIPDAIAAGAQAMITSDTKYHDFVDYADKILIADIGHFESERCTKNIFHKVITENFPNFAHLYMATENNPINYM